jgi:predicted nucleotidyltransferase
MIGERLVKFSLIKDIAELIKKKFNAKKVILFGSYAYGIPKSESDIDLLIVMDTTLKSYKQATLIRLVLDETFGISFPIDIVVRTPDEIEERLRKNDFFIEKVLRDGIPL